MLRIPLLTLLATLTVASELAQRGQQALITARAVLPPRALIGRQNQFTCAQATDTVCPDGSGCCPGGAACFSSAGVGLCSVMCDAAQPTCVFNGVTACCPVGDSCGGSLCIPAGMLPTMSSMSSSPTSSPPTSSKPTSSAVLIVSSSSISGGSSNSTISTMSSGALTTSVTTKTSTTTPMASTNNFNLGSTSSNKPLQVSVAAAPTNVWNPIINLAGLAVLGLAI